MHPNQIRRSKPLGNLVSFMRRLLAFFILFVLPACAPLQSEPLDATTADGRRVILLEDGTWRFVESNREEAQSSFGAPVYLRDETNLLNSTEQQNLKIAMQNMHDEFDVKVAIIIVAGTDMDSILELARGEYRLQWPNYARGILMLVIRDDRRFLIYTGTELTDPLSESRLNSIEERDIAPDFKNGDFYEGFTAGMRAISESLRASR